MNIKNKFISKLVDAFTDTPKTYNAPIDITDATKTTKDNKNTKATKVTKVTKVTKDAKTTKKSKADKPTNQKKSNKSNKSSKTEKLDKSSLYPYQPYIKPSDNDKQHNKEVSNNTDTTQPKDNNINKVKGVICGMDYALRNEIIGDIERAVMTSTDSDSDEGNVMFIGTEHERHLYAPAIIGLSTDYKKIIYDRQMLVKCFEEANDMTLEEADEWVSYNIERGLPYLGETAPIIIETLENIAWL
jgi:hypothetical protein